jgi:hypothetical protein
MRGDDVVGGLPGVGVPAIATTRGDPRGARSRSLVLVPWEYHRKSANAARAAWAHAPSAHRSSASCRSSVTVTSTLRCDHVPHLLTRARGRENAVGFTLDEIRGEVAVTADALGSLPSGS